MPIERKTSGQQEYQAALQKLHEARTVFLTEVSTIIENHSEEILAHARGLLGRKGKNVTVDDVLEAEILALDACIHGSSGLIDAALFFGNESDDIAQGTATINNRLLETLNAEFIPRES